MGPCFRRDDTRRPRPRPGAPSPPKRPIRPQASHSTQDSIPIRPLNSTIGRKIKQIRRRKTAGPWEEILSVRHYDWIAHFGRRTPDKLAVLHLPTQRPLSSPPFHARLYPLAPRRLYPVKISRGTPL